MAEKDGIEKKDRKQGEGKPMKEGKCEGWTSFLG
jgi:hypothetical protein